MNKRDFIFTMKILAHTAKCYFDSKSETMLNQGVRLREKLIKAQLEHPKLMKDREVREEYFERETVIRAFTRVALAEEKKRAEAANDAEIKRMEEEREKHRKLMKLQEEQFLQAVRDFEDDPEY